MKSLLLIFVFAFFSLASFAKSIYNGNSADDTLKLQMEGTNAYYQVTVKADSVPEGLIYVRAVQFMASKNFQQNYGYMEEGKLIYTTTQDLNINPAYIGDENDGASPYTVQFSITLDLKNGRYRYTVGNILFFFPTGNGNKRETLYDVYLKANNSEPKRVAREYKKIIDSFERYVTNLTNELNEGIIQKTRIYNPKF
jgi:hypothetical protein